MTEELPINVAVGDKVKISEQLQKLWCNRNKCLNISFCDKFRKYNTNSNNIKHASDDYNYKFIW
jgi:hypothetical protein